ncbi:MAG: DUF899 family protein [Gemmatimonadetes bacterium]|nr:DUF899 family protein [Gemmatimonadota bacterium]
MQAPTNGVKPERIGAFSMTANTPALPQVVSRAEWLAARKALLIKEKDLTPAGSQPPPGGWPHEGFGVSAFLRDGDRVFHTYSMYARGGDVLMGTYNWLDLTALGRQENWEQPPGRSDGPAMSWLRRHDRYDR